MTQHEPEHTLATHRIALSSSTERRPGKLVLRMVIGPTPGRSFEVTGTSVSVGRSRMADLHIDERSLSATHFELTATASGAWLRDTGSTNGTYFAGRRVRAIELAPGDEFQAGACQFALDAVSEVEVEALELEHFGELRGSSLVMRELFAQLNALGRTPLDVLITGETGTGKELTARTLHMLAPHKGPFIVLDCGALSPTLAEGTMFGFRKGTFTGADRDQPGVFEAAHGGTIFIDEIGELSLELQVKLLRVLDAREVSRLGEPGQVRRVDVRVIAATHRDLRGAVDRGEFREDLYYRLARGVVHTPPLRTRGEDIILLAESFLRRLEKQHELQLSLGDGAKRALRDHRWPGNVRELRNVVEQAAHIKRVGTLETADLRLGSVRSTAPGAQLAKVVTNTANYHDIHAQLDRLILPRMLEEHDYNLTQLSKQLGISRDKLRSRLKELELYSSSRGGRPQK